MRMRDEQATRGLDENRQQTGRSHRAVLLVEQLGQRLAGHVLHNEEADAVMFVIFEQRSDIRVCKIGGIMRFRTQAKQLGLLRDAQVAAQRLNGHGTTQLDIIAFPYFAHATLGQTASNL